MTIIISLPDIRPLSTNMIYNTNRFGHIYKSLAAVAWTSKVKKMIRDQYQQEPQLGDLAVTITINLKGAKRIDIDNSLKLLLDCANKILWKDDNLISKLTIERNCEFCTDNILMKIEQNDLEIV
jgi:Holliday junction resolvase RusA-like endonuclease